MRDLILKLIREQQEETALSKLEVKFFKYINSERDKVKTKKELKGLIKDSLKLLGMDEGDTEYYYELYIHNYRPNGDYENITAKELITPKHFKPKRTTNTDSYKFVKSKIPFQGSNLRGEWRTDNLNVPYYVVISYGWYPIYLWKEGKWYQVSDSYSSSTGKQMNRARPTRWDDNIQQKITVVSRNEMKKLESNLTYDELIQLKKDTLLGKKSELTNKVRNVSFGWYYQGQMGKVKFKITNVSTDGNKVNLDVEIIEVGSRDGQKMVPLGYSYTEDRNTTFSKKNIERIVYNYIVQKYREVVDAQSIYNDDDNEVAEIPDNLVFKINFKHKE